MAVTNPTYATKAALTVTAWDSLAADDWASSAALDNSSNLYMDVLIGGELAASATTLAAGESFDIYCAARYDADDANSYSGGLGDAFGANDSTLTEDTEFNPENLFFLISVGIENTAPDTTQDYMWGPTTIAQVFGGVLPLDVMLVLHNNTGSAMTTGNVCEYYGITYTTT